MVVFGREYILREATISVIIDNLSEDVLIQRLSASTVAETDIWDHLITDSIHEYRVLIIDEAEKLEDVSKLEVWLKDRAKSKNLYLILVSDNSEFMDIADPSKKSISLVAKGKAIVIKCNSLKDNELVSWVIENSGLSDISAHKVIKRCSAQLPILLDVCNKVRLLKPRAENFTLSEEALEALCPEAGYDFIQAILKQDRKSAASCIDSMDSSDHRKIISILSRKLDQIGLIRSHTQKNATIRQKFVVPDVPFVAVKELAPLVRYYNDSKQVSCRQLLAILDSYSRSGITCGILESLVALW